MDKLIKQIAFTLVGAAVASLLCWVITNWMPNTLSLVMAVLGGYLGYRIVK